MVRQCNFTRKDLRGEDCHKKQSSLESLGKEKKGGSLGQKCVNFLVTNPAKSAGKRKSCSETKRGGTPPGVQKKQEKKAQRCK